MYAYSFLQLIAHFRTENKQSNNMQTEHMDRTLLTNLTNNFNK